MAKEKPASKAVDKLEDVIHQDLIGDSSVPWEDCVDQLEQLAEFCAGWARQIREDHKDD